MELTSEDLQILKPMSRYAMAKEILGPILGRQFSPLPEHTASYSYLAWVLWGRSRAGGMLKGRPAYEARETFGHRARSAADVATSPLDWAQRLAESLGVGWDALSTDDRLTARELSVERGAHYRDDLRAEHVEEVLLGAVLLSDTMYQTKNTEEAA